ncbi:MAG TPA: transposase [bacterium]|nr:transposase [bacterium]
MQEFFADAFAGTLVTDFWAAYHAVTCERRLFCLAHLLCELERTSAVNSSPA